MRSSGRHGVANIRMCVCVGKVSGKSVFYAYFCDRFRRRHSSACVITRPYDPLNLGSLMVFIGEREPIDTDITEAIDDVLRKALDEAEASSRRVFFLFDGAPEVLVSDSQTVVFTSPDQRCLGSGWKLECTYYMPLWTLEELQEAARKLKLDLRNEEFEKRYETYVGVARHCLSLPTTTRTYGWDLRRVISWIDTADELKRLLHSDEGDYTRHHIVHYEPKGDAPTAAVLKIASTFVVEQLTEHLVRRQLVKKGGVCAGAEGHSRSCASAWTHL